MELKTARLTILIDPAKKQAFEVLCRTQDMTPSQVVRRLIREYMEEEAPPTARRAERKTAPARKAPSARKGR
jgi:antitoxin component of RelBE/YafQ-DinJ toxin-antitoxin module